VWSSNKAANNFENVRRNGPFFSHRRSASFRGATPTGHADSNENSQKESIFTLRRKALAARRLTHGPGYVLFGDVTTSGVSACKIIYVSSLQDPLTKMDRWQSFC
jgi:hypothetical protein